MTYLRHLGPKWLVTLAMLGFALLSLSGCASDTTHQRGECVSACGASAPPEWAKAYYKGKDAADTCLKECTAAACDVGDKATLALPGAGFIIVVVLILLVLLGAPLYVVVGGVATAAMFAMPIHEAARCGVDGVANNYPFIDSMVKLFEEASLLAIPFFMVAGAIMSRGDIAKRLVAVANALLGFLPGGLGLTAIGACVVFAAISGSSPVTVITIGAIMLPALAKAGYDEKLSLGLVTSAGSLGIVIPPSIPMIIFAIFATQAGARDVTVDNLFIAGIGPGILIASLLGIYVMYKCRNLERTPFNLKEVGAAIVDGVWALFLPVFVLGGIYGSIFNATEAAAISVVLALLIELVIHRSLKPSDLPDILGDTSVLMGSVLIIICVAFGLTEFLIRHDVPEQIVMWLKGLGLSSLEFVLLLNLLLLIVGCLMDIISAIILFVPLVVPIANGLGFDPVHLALIFIVNLEIGYLTPPLGMNLFVASGYFNKPFGLVMRSVTPFLLILGVSLVAVTAMPSISKGLLNVQNGYPVDAHMETVSTSSDGWSRQAVPVAVYDAAAPEGATLRDLKFADAKKVVAHAEWVKTSGGTATGLWKFEGSSFKVPDDVKSIKRLVLFGAAGTKAPPKLETSGFTLNAAEKLRGFNFYREAPEQDLQGVVRQWANRKPGRVAKKAGFYLTVIEGQSLDGKALSHSHWWARRDKSAPKSPKMSQVQAFWVAMSTEIDPTFTLSYRVFRFWQSFPDTKLKPAPPDEDDEDDDEELDVDGAGKGKTTKTVEESQSVQDLMDTEEYRKMVEEEGDDDDDDDEDDEELDLPPLEDEPKEDK